MTSTSPGALRHGQMDGLIPDLLSRLTPTTLYLPALRDHLEDLPELASICLYWARRFLCRSVQGFDTQVMHLLAGYSWPGNLWQLQWIVWLLVERVDNSTITVDDLRRLAFTCPLDPRVEERLRGGAAEGTESFDHYVRGRV